MVALAFGGALLLLHHAPLAVLVVSFGAYAVADGVLALAFSLRTEPRGRARFHVLEGVAGIVLGLDAVTRPPGPWAGLVHLVALWALATGLFKVAALVDALLGGFERLVDVLRGLSGGVSVLLGFWSFVVPAAANRLFVVVLFPYAVVFGVLLLRGAARLRRLARPSS